MLAAQSRTTGPKTKTKTIKNRQQLAKDCIEKCKKSKLFHITVKDEEKVNELLNNLNAEQLQEIINYEPKPFYKKNEFKAAIEFINDFDQRQKYSLIGAIEFDNMSKKNKHLEAQLSEANQK